MEIQFVAQLVTLVFMCLAYLVVSFELLVPKTYYPKWLEFGYWTTLFVSTMALLFYSGAFSLIFKF